MGGKAGSGERGVSLVERAEREKALSSKRVRRGVSEGTFVGGVTPENQGEGDLWRGEGEETGDGGG